MLIISETIISASEATKECPTTTISELRLNQSWFKIVANLQQFQQIGNILQQPINDDEEILSTRCWATTILSHRLKQQQQQQPQNTTSLQSMTLY